MAAAKTIDYYSNTLNKDMKLQVIGNWGYPILMFPSSGGQYDQNSDFGLTDSVMQMVDAGKIKLYNIETIDAMTFYGEDLPEDVSIHNYDMYMQFLQNELIPYICNECNTDKLATAGVSFGGFHAGNTAFRFPEVVSHLIAMSAVFSIRSFVKNLQDPKIYFNCPEEFMPNENAAKYSNLKIVLSTSDWDSCKPKNENMASILDSKGIPYWYDEKKWIKHDWPLWKMVFPEYVNTYFN